MDELQGYSSGDSQPRIKVDPCNLCSKPFKYKCPKCLVLTCSLPCVKAHKL